MKMFFDKNETMAVRRLFRTLGVDEAKYTSITSGGEMVVLIKPSAIVSYCMDMIELASRCPKILVESKVSKYQQSWDKHFPPSAFQRLKK